MNRQFLASFIILVLLFLTSCTSIPTESPPSSIQDTAIPTSISTQLPTELPLPTCTPIPSDYVYVIDHTVYDNGNPGLELGIWEAIDVMQQALETNHPGWAEYTWDDSDNEERNLAYYFWNKSRAQMIGVNPRVLLVTTGLALDWQIPCDQDLRDAISEMGVILTEHYREYKFNEDLRELYPQVANAPTYALFAFFDYDLKKLNVWASEYDRLFGVLQPRILSENCQPNRP